MCSPTISSHVARLQCSLAFLCSVSHFRGIAVACIPILVLRKQRCTAPTYIRATQEEITGMKQFDFDVVENARTLTVIKTFHSVT